MELHNLKYTSGSRGHKEKVVGRGYGSGMGKRSTRGQKGQKARKSGNVRQGFEGGQTPIYRRLPKVGFNNYNFAKKYVVVSLDKIEPLKETEINVDVLRSHGIVKGKKSRLPIKIIGNLEMKTKKTIHAHRFSANAKAAIEKANGSVVIIK